MNSFFGLIFHWGIYSIPAYDDPSSAQMRKIQNGSEWYLRRLHEKGTYRPTSGWKQTQNFHKEHYGDLDYKDFAKSFMPNPEKIDEWMSLAQLVGASYVILTAKHHDGYCLWPTKTTSLKSSQDLIKAFKESAKKYNLKFGLYYSWYEFEQKCTIKFIDEVVIPQINELKEYKPEIWWFDGGWACQTQYSNQKISEICKELRKTAEVNDRLGGSDKIKELYKDPNFLGDATYRVYGDREIPNQIPNVPWEHINTIGLSWGYNKIQQIQHYKNAEQLLKLYRQVREKHGRFLLNLGPDENGNLDAYEVTTLKELGQLMKNEKKIIIKMKKT